VATLGASELYGRARQDTGVFSYTIADDGSLQRQALRARLWTPAPVRPAQLCRGLFQARWNLTRRLGLLAGVRLNRTDESRTSGDGDDTQEQRLSATRLSGSLGANWRVWQDPEADLDDVVLYASYGNTFQPTQIDFGPEGAGSLLRPETSEAMNPASRPMALTGVSAPRRVCSG